LKWSRRNFKMMFQARDAEVPRWARRGLVITVDVFSLIHLSLIEFAISKSMKASRSE
jgi:hypothetical protein